MAQNNIPWARLTLGLAGFPLGYMDVGSNKNLAPGGSVFCLQFSPRICYFDKLGLAELC